MMRRVAACVVFLLLAGYLLTGVTEVRPGERALVRRFGRVLENKPGPGLWIGLPWGLDRVDRVPVDKLRSVAVGYQPKLDHGNQTPSPTVPGQLLTGDHNLVNIQVVLVYSVLEDELDDYVMQAERVDGLVARAAETALSEWVAGRSVDDVLLEGKVELPSWLVGQARLRLEPYRLGIHIRDEASVSLLYPPDEVKDKFDKVTRAQAGIRTSENAAKQEADRLVRVAESKKYRAELLAKAYQTKQLLLARAEAENFDRRRQQYHELRQKNPAFLAGIWWEEMGKLFAKLKDDGRIDLLDNHLGTDGLDITVFPPLPRKK